MRTVCFLLIASSVCAGEAKFRFPEAKLDDKAELKYVHDVPVLVVSGAPREVGHAAGVLALKPASRVLDYPRELLQDRKVDSLWLFFKGAGKSLYRNFPRDRRDELEAIAKGASVEREAVINGNTFFDLKKIFLCSALLVSKERSSTGGPLLGRNLDYPSLGYVHQYSLVTVYRTEKKLAFASVGFPGLVGVLSGMNEAGLALGVLEVFDSKDGAAFNKQGIPYGLCLRQALEEARTIDEAKKVFEKMERTTTINVAIADRQNVAVLEVSPSRVVRRESSDGICVTTNHFCSVEQRAEKPVNINRTFERFKRLEKAGKAEKSLTIEHLQQELHAVNLGTLTLQTMIFEPETLRLRLAIGEVPSSRLPLRTIELSPLFRGGR